MARDLTPDAPPAGKPEAKPPRAPAARPIAAAVARQVPAALLDQVETVRQAVRLKAFTYVQQSAQGVDERVLCKVCGVPIAGLIVHEDPVAVERGDGKVVIRERLIWAKFSNYAEVELTFAEGGRHLTPLSVDCVGRLDAQTAQDCYAADVRDLLARPGAQLVDWARWTKTVVSWRRVE